MDTISAKDARKITQENLHAPNIETFVYELTHRIKMVAKAGRSTLDPWLYLSGPDGAQLTSTEREAVKMHFVEAGFLWVDNPDPVPSHPTLRPDATISW